MGYYAEGPSLSCCHEDRTTGPDNLISLIHVVDDKQGTLPIKPPTDLILGPLIVGKRRNLRSGVKYFENSPRLVSPRTSLERGPEDTGRIIGLMPLQASVW